MQILYQLYEKFLTLLRVKKNTKNKKIEALSDTEKVLGSINFKLLSSTEIDMLCGLPVDLEDKDPEDIAFLAEQYANLLLTITTGELNEPIYKFLKNHMKKSNDANEILFIDNVILFWSFLHKEKFKKKSKKYDQNQPIIKPSQVFPH